MKRKDPILPAGEDPGEAWADAVLEPLRHLEVRCEVAASVMVRVAASRAARRPLPSLFRRPRLIWASCGAAAVAALAFLALPLVGVAHQGGLGMRQVRGVANAAGHVVRLLQGELRSIVDLAGGAAMPLLRAMVTLADAAAPICKSAGAIAALTGVLSILISLYVFAHARGTAPPSHSRNGFLSHGGMR
ncbi:MAG TPA: hypothetical protein VGA64_05970 [Candidatus Polarisedimenticolia bacterium]